MKLMCWTIIVMVCALSCACGPEPVWLDFSRRDVTPPSVTGVRAVEATRIAIQFSEQAGLVANELVFEGDVCFKAIENDGNIASIVLTAPLEPGVSCKFAARARDISGNSLSFAATVLGHNPEIPDILINEVRTDGSGEKTDLIELYVRSSGNLAGLCLFSGVPGNHEARYEFPAIKVKAGDFIIVHCKKLGNGGENDETGDSVSVASAVDCHPRARDLYCAKPLALSKNNGCLALCASLDGPFLDVLLYSNRRSDSDAKYGGFGATVLRTQATACAEAGAWEIQEAEITPEDCAASGKITGARSLCRKPGSNDTNSSKDWQVCATGKTTFGERNSSEQAP